MGVDHIVLFLVDYDRWYILTDPKTKRSWGLPFSNTNYNQFVSSSIVEAQKELTKQQKATKKGAQKQLTKQS